MHYVQLFQLRLRLHSSHRHTWNQTCFAYGNRHFYICLGWCATPSSIRKRQDLRWCRVEPVNGSWEVDSFDRCRRGRHTWNMVLRLRLLGSLVGSAPADISLRIDIYDVDWTMYSPWVWRVWWVRSARWTIPACKLMRREGGEEEYKGNCGGWR